MASQDPANTPAVPEEIRKKVVAAGAIGNLVEWYDFAIYGYLVPVLATNFFPSTDRTTSLLATFAVFGVAFLMRPLGGLIFGRLGDRVGRRNTLATVILLMGASTVAIGLLPTYAQIGALAPLLLVLARSLQGLSAGGETAGASAFVLEYSPPHRRGFYSSVISSTTYAAFVLGALVGTLLSASLSPEAFNSWGWRLAFLAGGPLALIGLYLRLRMEDTPAFRAIAEADQVESAPVMQTMRTQGRPMALLFGLFMSIAVGSYILIAYLPTYFQETLQVDKTTVYFSNAVALTFVIVCMLGFGTLSDRVGRKPLLIACGVLFILLPVPAFMLLDQRGLLALIGAQAMIGVAQATGNSVQSASMVEQFPTRVRYTSSAISYNLSIGLMGGTTPVLATYLVAQTGSPLAPAVYLSAIGAITLIAMLLLPESYRTSLVREDDVKGPRASPRTA